MHASGITVSDYYSTVSPQLGLSQPVHTNCVLELSFTSNNSSTNQHTSVLGSTKRCPAVHLDHNIISLYGSTFSRMGSVNNADCNE